MRTEESIETESFCMRLLSTTISWMREVEGYQIWVREEVRSKRTSAVAAAGGEEGESDGERNMSISGLQSKKPAKE